jgi:hypothetical protein
VIFCDGSKLTINSSRNQFREVFMKESRNAAPTLAVCLSKPAQQADKPERDHRSPPLCVFAFFCNEDKDQRHCSVNSCSHFRNFSRGKPASKTQQSEATEAIRMNVTFVQSHRAYRTQRSPSTKQNALLTHAFCRICCWQVLLENESVC